MTKAFLPYSLIHGVLADLSNDEFPTALLAWNKSILNLASNNFTTHFGFIYKGEAILKTSSGNFTLREGMYFSCLGPATLLGEGQGIIISRMSYRGVFSIGGPIESSGRLLYIDGATDTLLIPPVMKGDPCFNALYFPVGINQTPHTHPSMRVGMIINGRGECITTDEIFTLEPGQVFIIPAGALHSFKTSDSPMSVIAYHPESDYGPSDEVHPMINRTMINGVSASLLEEIRTRG